MYEEEQVNLHAEREWLITAIELIGGVAATARKLHVTRQAVYKWIHGHVPPNRVVDLERLTAKRVNRAQLYRGIDAWLKRHGRR